MSSRQGGQPFVIALDGPAASGKSSVGLGVARQLGFRYFDTGLLYRALTWLALTRGLDPALGAALASLVDSLDLEVDPVGRVFRAGTDITEQLHQPAVDAAVSAVSAHPAVRTALRPVQRDLIRPPGLVMAGRDIGTVVVPEAPLKIWLSASVEERARRRSAQTGEAYPSVLEAMRRRDSLDGTREVAPMAPAPDAIEILTDRTPPKQVISQIVELARARGAGAEGRPDRAVHGSADDERASDYSSAARDAANARGTDESAVASDRARGGAGDPGGRGEGAGPPADSERGAPGVAQARGANASTGARGLAPRTSKPA